MRLIDLVAAWYWSKILHCIIPTLLGDIEVKVTELETVC